MRMESTEPSPDDGPARAREALAPAVRSGPSSPRTHPLRRSNPLQRGFGRTLILYALLTSVHAPDAYADWRIVDLGSPWSNRRPSRPHTRYIVLHTTEGAERGSLEKLARDGEAHYAVGRDGTVHRIVDRTKIAAHAGRSMWNGHTNLDQHSLGIEVVGYHDAPPRPAQLKALKELLRQLRSIYNIPEDRVLTHSMVAYGAPNRWHRHRHRGRKRCAMRLADPSIRRALGLRSRPRTDPDVASGRLVVADADLYSFLFPKKPGRAASKTRARVLRHSREPDSKVVAPGRSPWDIAKEAYNSAGVRYTFPDGTVSTGDKIRDWKGMPPGTRLSYAREPESEPQGFEGFAVVGEKGQSPSQLAGAEVGTDTTIYLFPSGLVRTGLQLKKSPRFRFLLQEAPKGTRVLVGYHFGGYVTERRPPSVISGSRWNYPSTFYRFPDGRIRSGDAVDAIQIPKNTLVFFRK